MRNILRFLRNVPIRQKLTIFTMLTSGAALVLACLAFVTYEQLTFRRAMAADLSMLTDLLDDNLAPGLTFSDPKSLEIALNALSADPHIMAAVVYDQAGKSVASYQRADLKTPLVVPAARETGTRFESGRLDAFRRIVLAGETMGTIYIASDLRELTARLGRYALIVSVVLVLSSLAALLLSRKIQHVISGPISHLADVAKKVTTEKDYSVRAVESGEDELGRLMHAFNGMLQEIQTRDGALQEARIELEQRVEQRTGQLSQANNELRDSAARFHTVWESAYDAMRLMDGQGTIIAVNSAFCRLFGLKREELEGAPYSVTYTEQRDAAELLARFHARFRDHQIVPQMERRMTLRDGRVVDLEIFNTVIEQPGRPALLLGLFRDITERKRAEEQLRESQHLLQSTLDALTAHIAILDGTGVILSVNAMWRNFAEANSSAGRGGLGVGFNYLTVCECASGDCAAEAVTVAAGIRAVMAKQQDEFLLEYPCHSPDEERWFVVRVTRFAGDGPVRIVVAHENITQRKLADQQLELAHKQLIDTSRQAGMAEVATSVLHNVGNVLNSVNVSTTLVSDQVRKSKVANLGKAVALVNEHAADLGGFMTHDPRGQKLPGYLTQLASHLATEQATLLEEMEQLRKNIEHIKDIIAMQQSYARVSGVTETLHLPDLIEDALRLNAGALTRHEVEVVRDFAPLPPVTIDKHKVLQVLVNLIRNAKYACDDSGRTDKRMTVRVANGEGRVKIEIVDNGVGIPAENLIRIFNHGFTTRKGGHGFGLHSGALAAKELGGALHAQSDGPGLGATFTLELPLSPS